MRKFGLCLFYGLCVFTIAFSLFWMALPRLPLPEAPADETPPISGSVSSLVQAAAPTAAGYYLCDTGGRVAVYACNADGTPGALQQLTGIYVNLLPENDVLRIRRGIRVHSLPELQALLEDLAGDFSQFLPIFIDIDALELYNQSIEAKILSSGLPEGRSASKCLNRSASATSASSAAISRTRACAPARPTPASASRHRRTARAGMARTSG